MQRFVQQAESSDLEIRKVIRPTETQYSLISNRSHKRKHV